MFWVSECLGVLQYVFKPFQNQPTSPQSTPQDSPRSFSLSPTNIPTQNSIPARSSAPVENKSSSLDYITPVRSNVPLTTVTSYNSELYQIYTPHKSSLPVPTPNTSAMESSMLSGLEGEVQTAFSQPSSAALNVRNLRNDLLVAADSITGAMSSLVKELSENSASDDEDDNLNGKSIFCHCCIHFRAFRAIVMV